MPKPERVNNALTELEDAITAALEETRLEERRTVCKRFYVTKEEEQRIEEQRQGVSLSAFVRAKVLGSGILRPRPIVPQINREAYVQLANLRSNCNQIARAVNTAAKQGRDFPLGEAYLNQLAQLETLLVEIGLELSQAREKNE